MTMGPLSTRKGSYSEPAFASRLLHTYRSVRQSLGLQQMVKVNKRATPIVYA